MDIIRNLVSDADPVASKPVASDGEEALRAMFSRPEVFADRVSPNVPTLAERRQRRHRIAGLLSVAAAAVTAGVLVSLNLGPLTSAPAPAGTSTATASPTVSSSMSPTPTPTPSPVPSSGASAAAPAAPPVTASAPPAQAWKSYLSADGRISFEYPADWSVQQPHTINPDYPAVDAVVRDQAGKQLAALHYGASGGIGGVCSTPPVPYAVLDSVELALPYNAAASNVITPRFTFRALVEGDKVTASYGITSSAAGVDGKSCMFYNVVNGPAEAPMYSFADTVQVNAGAAGTGATKTFGSLEEARAYMQSPEYLNAKRMITSLAIKAG
ncbi:hypothetical protein F8G81_08425 [Arthrobacter sp. CDRTa11]|uniref:hypothetical protein n=1 Tax=Arthrobacter sp. CDRTa11 TaxID=2651199 RepID=UPI002265993E|nr:hypothetical protein [Arthrobacter sp. CDRTa11]UZX02635.1 hypothetical protein F8G81_08425 [Arthrobacter sp. CDRTa11]